jgi:peptidylprolyl isomerase
VRKLASIAVTAGLLVTLSACSTPTLFAGCDASGNAALVTADGGFGNDPRADFPTPLVADDAELAVVHRGDGPQVTANGAMDVSISVYDGASGEVLQSQTGPLAAVPIRTMVDGRFPFTTGLSCATEGSRVITAGTQTQLFGPEGLGLPDDPTLVVVSDITRAYLGKANGADQLPQAGLPAIVLAPDGRPGFTFPSATPPADLQIASLKVGNGPTVEEGDSVIVNYSGVVWGADATFQTTWQNQAPRGVSTGADSELPPGFVQALVGAKVGSQVIAVIPSDLGYPAGSAPAGVAEGDTIVFVIDVLAIEQPSDD